MQQEFRLKPVGIILSPLKALEDCPLQESEGAPEAVIQVADVFRDALNGIQVGDELVVLTWLHLANRDVLQCRRRNEKDTPVVGVFITRSPDRPNPVGVHHVKVLELVNRGIIKVSSLEVLNHTPVLDIKISR